MTTPTPTISIAGRQIGQHCTPFVIAEIGVNHDGSPARAIELLELAHRAGASAAKLQVFRADTLMHHTSVFAAYQQARVQDADAEAMLRRYELSDSALADLARRARELSLPLIATPFSLQDVDRLRPLGLAAVKLASPDLVNTPLLCKAASLGLPLILSTGAATESEIDTAAALVHDIHLPVVYLHCVSSYPTPEEHLNLSQIRRLGRLGTPIGYSDHSTAIDSGALAVAAGACVLERHLTYDKQALGPDHAASSSPAEFAEYVTLALRAWRLCGTMTARQVLPIEADVRTVSRQSLVLSTEMAAGSTVHHEHLTVQRPGLGIPASKWRQTVGRRITKSLPAGHMLQESDLA